MIFKTASYVNQLNDGEIRNDEGFLIVKKKIMITLKSDGTITPSESSGCCSK